MNTHERNTDARSQVKTEGAQGLNNPQGGQAFDIHQTITNQILEAMEQARATGRRLWDSQPSLPLNLTTPRCQTTCRLLYETLGGRKRVDNHDALRQRTEGVGDPQDAGHP